MNITEANAVNVVLRYLLGQPGLTGEVPSDDQAQAAAEQLADKAHKVLHAGLTSHEVKHAWSNVIVCPAQVGA